MQSMGEENANQQPDKTRKLVRMYQENWGQGVSSWRVEKARQDDLGGDSGAWSIELFGGLPSHVFVQTSAPFPPQQLFIGAPGWSSGV